MTPLRSVLTLIGIASAALPPVASGELIPFVLPYDDASGGITDFSGLNHAPAGKYGYIRPSPEGHLLIGGQRERFLGVNITADSCFPSHAEAEKVAGRLAKFGINIVRFHHMDNNWGGGSLIDYGKGNSRSLHADNLERLDYFIAQLKERGIYANINLINSREFLPSDGLDAGIAGLDWKARHVLGFVDPTFRDLEKEFATQLLTHVNPYTNLSYAKDPAIAVVEVNNENGIFQQYFDGNLDLWPQAYRQKLQARWNAWLSARYDSDDELLEAWSGDSEPLGKELILNGGFSSGADSWAMEHHAGAVATVATGTYAGRQGVRIAVTTAGSSDWHVQFNQGPIHLKKGQLYTLGFWTRADSAMPVSAAIEQAYDPWSSHHSFPGNQIGAEWREHRFTFYAAVSDNNLRINFNGFGDRTGTLYLADVSLREGGDLSASLPEGDSLDAGTIAINRRSESYLPRRALDWTRFLRDLALDYWTDMRDHIRLSLGYGGLINGTTIMNSPPNIQGVYDLADTHAYWQHPVFPGVEWDPDNWHVEPVSMVNTTSNTIGDLSRQRLKGYPHTVSEYRHAFPNPYAGEGPLLIAAYGALQDWDGIYFFDYARGQSWDQGYFDNYFNSNAHPASMANTAIAANLFRRGDIDAAASELLMNFHPDREVEAVATRGRSWNVGDGRQLDIAPEHALVQRLALSIGEDATGALEPDPGPAGPVYEASNEQLVWDLSRPGKGVVTIDSPRSKAIVGFMDGRSFELGAVGAQFGSTELDWATLALTLQEGAFDRPQSSAALLVVATGLTENTGMQWTDTARRSVGKNWGSAPTLVEAVPVTLSLPYAPERMQAWALDESGQRTTALPIESSGTGSSIALGSGSKSLWYEVQIAADPNSPPPYQAWMQQRFSEEDWADPSTSGPMADPDGDLVPNLLEFLTGTDPLDPDGAPPIRQTVKWRDRKPVFVYQFSLNPEFPKDRLDTLLSTDLAGWTSMSLTLQGSQAHLEIAPETFPAFSRLRVRP